MDDAQLVIEVKPLRSGPNEIRLTVTGRDGQPLTDATGALLQLQVAGSETAPIGITLTRESPGSFREKGVILGMEGRWKGQVTVQRQGAYDLHDHFELALTGQMDQHAPPPSSGGMKPVTVLAYLGIVGVTLFLLLMSIRRLNAAIQRIAVSQPTSTYLSQIGGKKMRFHGVGHVRFYGMVCAVAAAGALGNTRRGP